MVHSSAELEHARTPAPRPARSTEPVPVPGMEKLNFCWGLTCDPALLFAPSCSFLRMSAAITSAAGAGAVGMYGVRQLMGFLAALRYFRARSLAFRRPAKLLASRM